MIKPPTNPSFYSIATFCSGVWNAFLVDHNHFHASPASSKCNIIGKNTHTWTILYRQLRSIYKAVISLCNILGMSGVKCLCQCGQKNWLCRLYVVMISIRKVSQNVTTKDKSFLQCNDFFFRSSNFELRSRLCTYKKWWPWKSALIGNYFVKFTVH